MREPFKQRIELQQKGLYKSHILGGQSLHVWERTPWWEWAQPVCPIVPLYGQAKSWQWHVAGEAHSDGETMLWERWDQSEESKDSTDCSSQSHKSANQSLSMLFITPSQQTEHVYYLYKSEIIWCYLLKSHLPHHHGAKVLEETLCPNPTRHIPDMV